MNEWIDEWQEESLALVILALRLGVWKRGPSESKTNIFLSSFLSCSFSLTRSLILPLSFILSPLST